MHPCCYDLCEELLHSDLSLHFPSCYGAETPEQPCCNTCEEVREAYRKKGWAFSNPHGIAQCIREGWTDKLKEQVNEGCRAHGYLEVSKVAGNFHFAPGKSFQQHNVHGMLSSGVCVEVKLLH